MRLSTLEDLLLGLRTTGLAQNRAVDPEHHGMEGAMYEGLADKLLTEALFDRFDLKIRTGKIVCQGQKSNQVDCMIVTGEGEQLPNTARAPQFYYDISQVIAVVEVTKNLTPKKLEKDMAKLARIAELAASDPTVRARIFDGASQRMQLDSYKAVARRPLPPLDQPPPTNLLALYNAYRDPVQPLRIVWGFEGFPNELRLRAAFANAIKKSKNVLRDVPSLVVSSDLSIVKCNGMPFVPAPGEQSDLCYSQNHNAIRNLLHVLWYRLTKSARRDMLAIADGRTFHCNRLLAYDIEQDPTGEVRGGIREVKMTTAMLDSSEYQPKLTQISIEECILLQLCHGRTGADISAESFWSEFRALYEATLELSAHKYKNPKSHQLQWRSIPELLPQVLRSGLLILEGRVLHSTLSRGAFHDTPDGLFAGEDRDGRFINLVPEELRSAMFPDDSDPTASRYALVVDFPDGTTQVVTETE